MKRHGVIEKAGIRRIRVNGVTCYYKPETKFNINRAYWFIRDSVKPIKILTYGDEIKGHNLVNPTYIRNTIIRNFKL